MSVLNRSRLLFLFALIAVLLLVACSSPTPVPPTPAPTAVPPTAAATAVPPTAAPPAAAAATKAPAATSAPSTQAPAATSAPLESQVFMSGSGGTFQTAMEKQVLPLFTQQTGVKVTYTGIASGPVLSQLQANPQNPPYDVVWGTDQVLISGKASNIWAPLDPKVVTNLANVYPEFYDPDNMGVEFGFFINGIEYNEKVFKDKGFPVPTSWNDLWNPAYKGHVGAYAWSVSFSPSFLTSLSKSLGGSESNTDAAFAKLKTLTPNLLNVFPDSGSLDQSLSSGDTWIAYNSNARTQALAKSGVPLAFVAPKEGAGIVNNPLMTPAHAPHPRAAQALINFILSDQVQNLLPTTIGYSPVSKSAVIPPELVSSMPSPVDRLKYVFTDWSVIVKRNQDLSKLWTQTIETR